MSASPDIPHLVATAADEIAQSPPLQDAALLLSVQRDADAPDRWVWLIHRFADGQLLLHVESEGAFASFAHAVRAGALALAVHEGQDYDDEAVDPGGSLSGVGYD